MDEQVIDLLHKAIYAYATGAAADRLIEGPRGQTRRKSSHYYASSNFSKAAEEMKSGKQPA